jgi:hypothetical protein
MEAVQESRSRLGVVAGRVFVVLVGVLAVAAWAIFANRVATVKPVPHVDVPQPDAVVWHDRVYQSREQFADYLQRNGKSYDAWAHIHPDAAALLAHLATVKTHGSQS